MRQVISKSNLRFFLIPILLLLIFVRCDDDETPFPYVSVNVYLALDTHLGSMVVDSYKVIEGYGLGGLIIFRKDFNVFMAFDLSCTYEASRECKLQEDDVYAGIFECPCCGSEFWMIGGDLAGSLKQGPANAPLKQYNCYFDGINTVRVTN